MFEVLQPLCTLNVYVGFSVILAKIFTVSYC